MPSPSLLFFFWFSFLSCFLCNFVYLIFLFPFKSKLVSLKNDFETASEEKKLNVSSPGPRFATYWMHDLGQVT